MASQLDPTDEQIINLLRANGRIANVELARRVGVSEATVRKRLARLIDQDLVRIGAFTNRTKLGYHFDSWLAIDTDIDKLTEVARRLSEIDRVRYVGIVSGIASIICAASFKSRDEYYSFITENLASIAGIRKVNTAHTLKVVKRSFDWFSAE